MLKVVSAVIVLSTLTPVVTNWDLPIATLTPGITNSTVTQANISTTICKSGWTATIRPPVSYTNKLKAQQLATTYKYEVAAFGSTLTGYEEDHLISLELGGNPTDPKNLWPQPYAGNNSHQKDVVETKLKTLVCTGKLTLVAAQKAISTNWVDAYSKYVAPVSTTTIKGN